MPEHRLIEGDARWMSRIPEHSVHLIVTSPPYWQIKDYGHERQIGYHDDLETYLQDLQKVWLECDRVLKPGCRMCINIGDQFARSVQYGRYKVISIQSEIIRQCEEIGLDYMGAIIWQKVTNVNTTGGAVIMGSYPFPRNGIVKLDYEYILLFKKLGTAPKPTKEQKELSKIDPSDWNKFFAGHWNITGERMTNHLAAFPLEIPSRLIRMFSFVGETVLDPFLGSGTTAIASEETGRNSVGYELNKEYLDLAQQRLSALPNASILRDKSMLPERISPKAKSVTSPKKTFGTIVNDDQLRRKKEAVATKLNKPKSS